MTDKDQIKDALNEDCILGLNADENGALGEVFTEFFAADTLLPLDSTHVRRRRRRPRFNWTRTPPQTRPGRAGDAESDSVNQWNSTVFVFALLIN